MVINIDTNSVMIINIHVNIHININMIIVINIIINATSNIILISSCAVSCGVILWRSLIRERLSTCCTVNTLM